MHITLLLVSSDKSSISLPYDEGFESGGRKIKLFAVSLPQDFQYHSAWQSKRVCINV